MASRPASIRWFLLASFAMLAAAPGRATDVVYVPVPVYSVYPFIPPWDYCAGLPRCAPSVGYALRVAERRRDRQRALAADAEAAGGSAEFPLPRDGLPRPEQADPAELQPRYRDAGNVRPEFSRTGRALDELRAEEEAARAAAAKKEQRAAAPDPGSPARPQTHSGQPPARAQAPEPQTRPMVLKPARPSNAPGTSPAKPARDKPGPAAGKPKVAP